MSVALPALFVCAAALGALLRAEAGRRANTDSRLPVGTLFVNISGSFLIGLLNDVSSFVTTVICVALIGTYTTVSSFAREVMSLVEGKRYSAALLYVGLSVVLSVSAAIIGMNIDWF